MFRVKRAFTLLEIMVVMFIIGILATMVPPRIVRKKPEAQWETVLDELNNIVYYARQEAIARKKIYRINFHAVRTDRDTVQVELEGEGPEKPGRKVYELVKSYYFNPVYKFPEEIRIEAIYQDKKEQLEENNDHGYCYVIPDGLVQEIFVHLIKTEDERQQKMTVKMLPFLGRFELVE